MKIFSGRMAAMLLCALAPLPAAAAAPSLLPARVEQAARAYVAAGEYPALVIAVVDGRQSRVYGFGKLADGKAPNADTVFEIGSISKTFTATLLAEAATAGSVQLDEPVAKLLPGFSVPSRGGKFITLENLATQHSGLPRLPDNLKPSDMGNPYADYDAADLKAFLAGYKLPRDPGSAYEYSNLGFGLLGYALAQQAHATYGALAQEEVFGPLRMRMSGATLSKTMRAHLAAGHDETGKAVENWDFGALAGAGAIKSTGADMLRYLEANMGVLKTPLYSAMQFAQKPRSSLSKEESIGLAWMTLHDPDGNVIWHNGMTGGYSSFIGFTADGKRGVVVLANIEDTADDLGFATLLADAKLPPAEKAISMAPQALGDYVGSYQLAPHFIVTISRQGSQLYAQATGQGAFPIFPSARDEFFARITDIRISFERNAQGKVANLVLHQNGDHAAPRIGGVEAAEAASNRPVAALPAATLSEYVGHYRLAPDVVFDVTLKGDQLYAQLTGQSAFPVYASAKDKFFYTVVDAQLDFVRDDKSKVIALVLHQNGTDQRAPRVEN
ncbi:MAG: serine hydrolase [Gammaproteobacteria bacterium]